MKKKNIIIILVIIVLLILFGWLILRPTEPDEDTLVLEDPLTQLEPPFEVDEELMAALSQAEGITSMTYDLTISSPGEAYDVRFWQKDSNFKMQMSFEDETLIFIADAVQGLAYQYLPDHNMAMELDLAQTGEILRDGSIRDQALALVYYDPVVVGRELYNDKECLVVEYMVENEQITMWIWEEYGLPIKTESVVNGYFMSAEVTNISFDPPASDIFDLPEGVEITDVPMF